MYALDTTAAREAENQSNYLDKTGKYKGKFIRAEKLISTNKGTHGVGFTFETEAKQTTRFDIWTMDKDNKPLMGFKSLSAIMACMKVRNITPVAGKVDRYNYDTKKTEVVDADVFKELIGKPIGLLMRNTEYAKMKDGRETGFTGWRLELFVPFDAETEMTASEILDRKTKAERLASIVATLADRPMKSKPLAPAHQSGGHDDYAHSGQVDEDSIPF